MQPQSALEQKIREAQDLLRSTRQIPLTLSEAFMYVKHHPRNRHGLTFQCIRGDSVHEPQIKEAMTGDSRDQCYRALDEAIGEFNRLNAPERFPELVVIGKAFASDMELG